MSRKADRIVTSEIAVTDRGAVVTCRGEVSVEGIEASVAALARTPGFSPSLPTVWDLSGTSSPGLAGDDMKSLAARMSAFRRGADRPRVAIVAAHDSTFAGARMFAGLNEERLQTTFRVCRDLDEAVAWAFGGEAVPGSGESETGTAS